MLKHATKLQTVQHATHISTSHDLLTIHEVAERLRVDDTTVRRWVTTGALAAIKFPHRGKRQGYRIRRSDIEALFAKSK